MNTISKNRWQVRIAATIIFVLGFAAGILALNIYRGAIRYASRYDYFSPADRFDRISEELQLTADQKTKVQEILNDTRVQLQALRRESEPRVKEIRRQADGRLQTVLTPEQWQQFQTLRDEMRPRRGRGGPRGDRL